MDEKKSVCNLLSREELEAVFSFLTQEEVKALCPYLELREWPADSVVMRKGEAGDYMGFLVEGRLAVKKETGFRGKYILVAILEKGTMVGEISVILKWPRSATIVAMDQCRLLTLSGENMEKLTRNNPALSIKLLKRILYVMGLRLRQAGQRLSELM